MIQVVIFAVRLGLFSGIPVRPLTGRFSVGGNSVARAGQETYLFCNRADPAADPPSSYVWVKDDKVIPGHTKQVLTLSSLTRQDVGYYQCGTPGSDSHGNGVYLHVFVPGDMLPKPLLEAKQWPVVGRHFSLYCYYLEGYISSPDTTYTWYKNSVEINGQKGNFLTFSSVTEKDGGEYTCTAREGAADTTSLHSYLVDVRPLVPPQLRIKPPGPVVKGVRGENLTMTCDVTRAFPGVPVDGYSWSYASSSKSPQRPLLVNMSTLTLGPLTLEDRGQYVCQARNDQLYSGSNINLTGQASVTVDIVYLESMTLTPDLEVSEGDRVTLTCAVDSLPTAQLAWTVRGQEVRKVTDNVDHYVISRAACSDSGSYTCAASNTELPGRHRHATLQLLVHCRQASISEMTKPEIGAIFHFPLPDGTPMVVVHPGGHDVISVRQGCSYNVSSAFQSRCLQPWCDSTRHSLSFTLTNVTEEDEGEYICLEEETHRRPIPNCSKKLAMKHDILEPSADHYKASVIGLAAVNGLLILISGILIGTKYHRAVQKMLVWLRSVSNPQTEFPMQSMAKQRMLQQTFERIFNNGEVYIFPSLVPPVEEADETPDDESTPLFAQYQTRSGRDAEFKVKDMLRFTFLQSMSARPDDLPSFILHNTRLSKEENVILVVDNNVGVVVMVVNTAWSPEYPQSAEEAARHLVDARDTVRRKLQGLVTSGAVRAVLSLPCLSHNEIEEFREHLKILRSHPDIELLAGQGPQDFKEWLEGQGTGRGRQLWQSSSQGGDSPDTLYKQVASRFLTLAGCTILEKSPESPASVDALLLTPAQMEVRDSTARHLHIWGPPGSGKTTLLVHRARQWLAEGKAVILAVGMQFFDIQLAEILKAVRAGLGKEECSRIRVCCTFYEMARAVKTLRGMHENADICLIIDILREPYLLKLLLPDVKSGHLTHVWTAGWRSLLSANNDLTQELRLLDWKSINLPDCLRCTDNTVELLNKLGHGEFSPLSSCSVPRDQDIPAWRVVDHCLHPDHVNTVTSCGHCKQEMSVALPSMKQGLEWNDWIALHTGDPNMFVNCEPLKNGLVFLGMPVSYDSNSHLRHETDVASSESRRVTSTMDFARFRERVTDGVDEHGQPTLHLLRVEDFRGMEREGVILVHWDKRDNDPEHQGERAKRLEEHRHQWIQAASRSTGQVLLLLLSPSPARSLLGLPEVPLP